jgi:uncharacterized protein with FMN-binding domain
VSLPNRPTSNLIALASAAVVAIYGAGYMRTSAAAQRFAGDSERHPATVVAGTVAVDTFSVQRDAPIAQSGTTKPDTAASASTPKVAPVAEASRETPTTEAQTTPPPPAAEPGNVAAVRPMDSTPVIATPLALVVPVAPVAPPASPASVAQVVDSATHPADSVRAMLKDGTYSGYGTSRHGDIEAAVQIKDGRIVSAYITQCLTRYSCSRIAAIIPQVVARQSAEVDYVSGATQSSDAFYYAVREALSKAK